MLIRQLVVCAVLMFVAGLMLKTVINLRTQDLGHERNVLPIPIAAEGPGRPPEAAAALVEHLRQQIAAIPGVQAAGVFASPLLDYLAYWVDGSERLRTDRGEAAARRQVDVCGCRTALLRGSRYARCPRPAAVGFRARG